jgi:tetratricopeptide (TPR) repeat protein
MRGPIDRASSSRVIVAAAAIAIAIAAVAAAGLRPAEAWGAKTDPQLRRRLQAAHRLTVVGRYDEAKELYRKLYEDHPESEAVIREYGETLVATKDYGEAEALYLDVRRRTGRPLAYASQLESIHMFQKRYGDAASDCLDVLAANRGMIDWVRGELSRIGGVAGDVDLVVDAISNRADAHPQFSAYRMLAVEMLVRAARVDEAAAMLQDLRGDDELSADDFNQLGIQLDALGERDLTVSAFRIALERKGSVSGVSSAAFKLAEILAEGGRAEESRRVLQSLSERYPNSGIAFRAELQAASLESEVLDRPDRALALYEKLLTRRISAQTTADVKKAIGKCLLRLGRLSEAREIYSDLAAVEEPVDPEARFMAAEVSFYMGDIDSALALYSSLASGHPDWELANDAIDRTFLLSENAGEGRGGWVSFAGGDSAGAEAPDAEGANVDPLGLFAAAELLASIGRPDSALTYLTAIVDDHSDSPLVDDAMFRAGDLYLAVGDVDHAIAELEGVAEKYPDGRLAPIAREKLGDIWWTKKGDGRRALEEYTKGLDEYPNSLVAPRVRDKVARLRQEVG